MGSVSIEGGVWVSFPRGPLCNTCQGYPGLPYSGKIYRHRRNYGGLNKNGPNRVLYFNFGSQLVELFRKD